MRVLLLHSLVCSTWPFLLHLIWSVAMGIYLHERSTQLLLHLAPPAFWGWSIHPWSPLGSETWVTWGDMQDAASCGWQELTVSCALGPCLSATRSRA